MIQNEHVHIGVIGGVPPAYNNNSARYVNQHGNELGTPHGPVKGAPSAWDKDPVPEDLPAPSAKYQQQYQQYQQEMRDSYRTKSARNVTEVSGATAYVENNLFNGKPVIGNTAYSE